MYTQTTTEPRNLGFVSALFKQKRKRVEAGREPGRGEEQSYTEKEEEPVRRTPMAVSVGSPKRRKSTSEMVEDIPLLDDFIPLQTCEWVPCSIPTRKNTRNYIQLALGASVYEAEGLAAFTNNEKREFFRLVGRSVKYISDTVQSSLEERERRHGLVTRITELVHSLCPTSEVHLFGSVKTGLCLTQSDTDILVMKFEPTAPDNGYWQPPPIRVLANTIDQQEKPRELRVIDTAQVPVIKMVDSETGLKLDITLDQVSGLINTDMVSRFIREHPLLRPLALVIKYYLKQESMNETFQGGIGSYLLVLLVVSLLQIQAKRTIPVSRKRTEAVCIASSPVESAAIPDIKDMNGDSGTESEGGDRSHEVLLPESEEEALGLLFVDFFRVYGIEFDYDNVAISVGDGGALLDKQTAFPFSNPGFLAVQDPNDAENDVGAGCWNIVVVREFFKQTFLRLTSPENVQRVLTGTVNPLSCLIKDPQLLPSDDEQTPQEM